MEWRTSDEILDAADPGLTFFAEFIPVYDEAVALAGAGRNLGIDLAEDIRRPYDELRGIDFALLHADAEQLDAAVESSANHRHNLERYWAGLSGWHGPAAEAARAHRNRVDGLAHEFLRRAAKASGAIAGCVVAVQDALLRYTANVRELDGGRCGNLAVDEVYDAIAEGDSAALGYFIDEFDAKKAAFDAYTRNVQEEIQGHYDIMLTHLRPLTEEAFAELPDPGEFREEPAMAARVPAQAVMISQGGNTISLSTPDDQGRVRVSLAAVAGQPRTYELDMGLGTSAAGTTGETGPDGVDTPHGGGGAKDNASAPRLPATLFPWTTTKPVDRLHPDEDGKVVIKDGKVMITVAADDDADELTITFDDGAGNRTSYRVDYHDPANPTLRQAATERT